MAKEKRREGAQSSGLERLWIVEQDRISREVIDRDDVCWLLNQADPDTLDTTAAVAQPPQIAFAEQQEERLHSTSNTDGIQSKQCGGDGGVHGGIDGGVGGKGVRSGVSQLRLRLVGGVDISFVKGSEDNACASLVILEYPALEVVYEAFERVTMEYPYVSGFLAFREVDHLVRLVEKLRRERPDLEPDVLFVDGNGRLHPRGAGLACHLGVLTGLRTVGLGKTFLHVDGLTKGGVREHVHALLEAGERESQLVGASGAVWGAALVPREEGKGCVVTNPVFVSVGHRVSLETCVALTKAVGRYRVPEPIRQADMRSREVIRAWLHEQQRTEQAHTEETAGAQNDDSKEENPS